MLLVPAVTLRLVLPQPPTNAETPLVIEELAEARTQEEALPEMPELVAAMTAQPFEDVIVALLDAAMTEKESVVKVAVVEASAAE